MSNENQTSRVNVWGLFLLKLAGLMFLISLVGGIAYWSFSKADLVIGQVLALAVPIAGWFLFIMLLGAVTFGEVMERSHVRGAQAVADISASTMSSAAQMMDAVANVMDAGMRIQREMWTLSPPPEDEVGALPSPEEAAQFLPSPTGVVDTRQAEDGSYEVANLIRNIKERSER